MGIDPSPTVIQQARKLTRPDECELMEASVYNLPFEDKSFHHCHTHQVLQHLESPVQAIIEMKRVAKELVVCTDVDYETWITYPHFDGIEKWKSAYRQQCRRNLTDPDCGRRLKSLYLQAGFHPDALRMSGSTVTYSSPNEVHEISTQWADRIEQTSLGEQLREVHGRDAVETMIHDWRKWGQEPDAILFYVNIHVIGKIHM